MRIRGLFVILVLCVGFGMKAAQADDAYPSRPITIVVPFSAGGPLDFVARAVGEKLSASLKQPVIVENRGGAAGNLGTAVVAKAAPDGYTLLVVLNTTLTVNPWLYKNLTFDPIKDLRPISLLTNSSQTLVVHPSMPAKSLAEFVAAAKQNPVTYAHAGYGSPGHLAMEYFRLRAGFKVNAVPYKGNAPLVTDLLGGQVQAGFVSSAGVVNHVRAGKLRGLAISAEARSPLMPDIPTVAESGYPGFKVNIYFTLLAPAGVPDKIATLLESETRKALQDSVLQAKLRAQDLTPTASTAAEAKSTIAEEHKLWGEVVKDAQMRIQ